jgi:hypothetical protein
MEITVRIQLGAGGEWHTEVRANAGPLNLMRAHRAAVAAGAWTSGVGGYTTVTMIGGHVIDPLALCYMSRERAREICQNPELYAPPE